MSKTCAFLSVTLLAMAACVTEQPAELDRPEDLMVLDEINPIHPDFDGDRDRLPTFDHPAELEDRGPTPIAVVFPIPDNCTLVSAAHARSIADAIRRSITLMDQDLAEGEPGSMALAIEARAALKSAYAHAETARDTLLDGELSFDGDASVTSPAEGAVVRGEEHEVIAQLDLAIDRAVQRAYERRLADRGAGYSARQTAVLAGKALSAAHDLRGRAIECELGIWR